MRLRRKYLEITGATGLLILTWVHMNPGFSQEKKPDLARAIFYGVEACNKCHIPTSPYDHDLVSLNEYPTWKIKDRHSLAYAVLESPRGKQMADLLGVDVTATPMCLSCHATTFFPQRNDKSFSLKEGVSCDGCHGPAEHWITDHAFKKPYWRGLSAEDKENLGMFNVRDPVKRAELCLSCHVGSPAEGKVITHSMYAAGHPPLPSFELASFSKNLPPHWMDLRDVPYFKSAGNKIQQKYHFATAPFQNTRFVLAGGMVAMRQAMELLSLRADTEMKTKGKGLSPSWPPPWLVPHLKHDARTRWPELEILKAPKQPDWAKMAGERWPEIVMGQADCYACHHDLKTPSWRQKRGYASKPGRPQFQLWPLALAGLTLDSGQEKEFSSLVKQLNQAFDGQPFGDPKQVSVAAQNLARFFQNYKKPKAKMNRDFAHQVLKKLTTISEDDYPDFDSARQIAWAFHAIFFDSWNADHPHREKVREIFKKLDDDLNLTLQSEVRAPFTKKRKEIMTGNLDKTMDQVVMDKTFLKTLQNLNDQELKEALVRVSRYDPVGFKKRLKELSVLVEGSK